MTLALLATLLAVAAPVPAPPPGPADPAAGVIMLEPQRLGLEPPATAVVVSPHGLVVAPVAAVGARRRLTVFPSPGQEAKGMVVHRDEEQELVLLTTEPLPGAVVVPLAEDGPPAVGTRLWVRGVEGGLPWRTATATVVSTQSGTWGQPAQGYLVCDGQDAGTGADVGAAVVSADGRLLGIHMGRLRSVGAPPHRFVVLGAGRLRRFLETSTLGMPLGSLAVTSSVPGARVLLDGREAGVAPLTLERLPVEWHEVQVEAPGHAPHATLVRTGVFEPSRVHAELRPAAVLTITSNAKETTVALDGAPPVPVPPWGVTAPPGEHHAEVGAPGFRPQPWSGTLALGSPVALNVKLVPRHGLVSVDSVPAGAKVTVDGKEAGVTPLKDLKLRPGPRHLALALDRHHAAQLPPVLVVDGASVDLGLVRLQPFPARLSLAPGVVEGGDQVLLDGQRVSGSSWKVEPGYHDIEVRRSWHTPGKLRVKVGPAEERAVAPRPEVVPERGQRRLKVVGGVVGLGGSVALVAGHLATLGIGVALLAGTFSAYGRYHRAVTRSELDSSYALSNVLLWLGVATLVGAVAPALASVAAVVFGVYSLVTLPSDPSDRAPAPARPAGRGAP
jgi:hypothetical protein